MCVSPLGKYLLYQLYHARVMIQKADPCDPEPLHQFRVSLRKMRSLLKLFFPKSGLFPKELKRFLKSTNSLRELDVFLSDLDPEKHEAMIERLSQLREREYRNLDSQTLERIVETMDRFYDLLIQINPDPGSHEELLEIVLKYYDETMKEYRELPKRASQKELHALRIRFKTSRYALEFLSEGLLDDEKEKMQECKRFQNRFGELQDLANQIHWLKSLDPDRPIPGLRRLICERTRTLKALKASNRSA